VAGEHLVRFAAAACADALPPIDLITSAAERPAPPPGIPRPHPSDTACR